MALVLHLSVERKPFPSLYSPVGDLVPDDHADPTVVQSRRDPLLVDRSLQDPRRDGDGVHAGIVEGVHDGRVDDPFVSVHRLVHIDCLASPFPAEQVEDVPEMVAPVHRDLSGKDGRLGYIITIVGFIVIK